MLAMGNAIAAYLDSPAPTLPPTHERGRLLDSASPAEAIWKSYTAMPECASWWESYATDPAAMWRAQVRHAAKKATSKGDAKRKKENAKRKEPATKRGAGGGRVCLICRAVSSGEAVSFLHRNWFLSRCA
jgi:hypothetical protein